MSEQYDIFQARTARDEGIDQVSSHNLGFMDAARSVARMLCRVQGTVTSDDVRKHSQVEPDHPNAWGAVFRSKEFEFTGEYRQSKLVSRHGAMQRVWRLKG